LDKWLWQARFFRSRHMSAALIADGYCRINGNRTQKPGYGVAIGDVLTFVQGDRIRVIRVAALGLRRGPAAEAQSLYLDLDPQPMPDALE
jgi:ribosome-associated heat shock protein Hsp15